MLSSASTEHNSHPSPHASPLKCGRLLPIYLWMLFLHTSALCCYPSRPVPTLLLARRRCCATTTPSEPSSSYTFTVPLSTLGTIITTSDTHFVLLDPPRPPRLPTFLYLSPVLLLYFLHIADARQPTLALILPYSLRPSSRSAKRFLVLGHPSHTTLHCFGCGWSELHNRYAYIAYHFSRG